MSVKAIELPERLDNYSAVIHVADEIADSDAVDVLDARRTEYIGALGAVMLACAAASRKQPVARVIPPRAHAAKKFAQETLLWDRLCSPLEAGDVQHSENTLALRQLRALDPVYTTALAELLASHVAGITEDVSHLVQLCLNETLQNVFEHAHSSVGCFVLARWHKKGGNLRLAVADRGRGIAAALRDIPKNRSRTDTELVHDSVMVYGFTSRPSGVGGRGLKTIRELVTARDGRLSVHSGHVSFSARSRGVSARPGPYWQGTAIEMDFRPTAVVAESPEEEFIL